MLIGRFGPSLKGSATSRTVPPTSISPRTVFSAIEPLFAVWRQRGAHALNRRFRGQTEDRQGWSRAAVQARERAIVSFDDLVGAGEDRAQVRRSSLRRRPAVNAAHGAAHQLGAVAIGQPVGNAECLDPILVGQQFDRACPVGAPHAAVEAKGRRRCGRAGPRCLGMETARALACRRR